jgi:PAS domain S-box-containing protein
MSAAGKSAEFEASLGEILNCVAQPVWVVNHAGVIHFANPAALAALGYESLDELIGKPGHETIHYKYPDGSPFPVEECPMLRPRQTGETISVDEDWFIRSDGTMFPVAYTSAPLELESGRGAVVAFTDIEEKRSYEQSLHDHDVILEALAQPVLTTQKGVIQYVNTAAVEALGYDDASEIVGQVGHWLVHYKRPDGSHFPIEECPLWTASMKHEPVKAAEDMWVRKDGSMFPISYSAVPLGLHRGVGMAVAFEDISERLAAERTERERDIAEARATELAAARRRVIEAADAERQRVTRDLHDGAQQDLVNVITSLQLAKQTWPQPERARELLDSAFDAADRGLRDLRDLAAGMHPEILVTRGLGAAVESLAHRMPLPVELIELPSGRLPADVEASVYFFVCEALTNVAKHAQASRATIRLAVKEHQLAVVVADDGMGGASPESGGSGLAGLADRIAALEGRLELRSEPGRGTTLSAVVPLARGDQRQATARETAVKIRRRGARAPARDRPP